MSATSHAGPQPFRAGLATPLTALVVLLAACTAGNAAQGGTGTPPGTTTARTTADAITIYAASSLKAVLAALETAYTDAYPGVSLTFSTDSSAALEAKIEQGAPADVFLSADATNAQKLADAGFATGAVTAFAGNSLTLIVPSSNPAGITTPVDLARDGVKVIAAGDAVPITRYANAVVANLAGQPGYPADFGARYAANIVSKEDNAAAIVAKVELGEGDAGIVYMTDARSSAKITAIAIPRAANVAATYAGVVVRAAANRAAGEAFLAWLAGPGGQAILASFGFQPAP